MVDNALKLLLMSLLREQDEMPESEQFLIQVIPYIDQHYQGRITLEDLSQLIHISKSYLTRQFRKYTGTTVVAYINHLRVEKARELLMDTSLNGTEIAYRTGFESPKYFYRIFRRETGLTPAEFRRKYRREASMQR